MNLLGRLLGLKRKYASTEPTVNMGSAEDRAVARQYWDAQVAADLKRRGVPTDRRKD